MSGDYKPDPPSGRGYKRSWLPGAIAYGTLVTAAIGQLFSPCLEHGHVKKANAHFSGMVFLGERSREVDLSGSKAPTEGTSVSSRCTRTKERMRLPRGGGLSGLWE